MHPSGGGSAVPVRAEDSWRGNSESQAAFLKIARRQFEEFKKAWGGNRISMSRRCTTNSLVVDHPTIRSERGNCACSTDCRLRRSACRQDVIQVQLRIGLPSSSAN